MASLAGSYFNVGRREEAVKLAEQALDLSRKVSGPEHPDTLRVMFLLSFFYDNMGRRDEALKLREKVLTLLVKALGPEHPDAVRAVETLAISNGEAGRLGDALKLWEEVLRLSRKVFGLEDFDTLQALNEIGWLLAVSDEAGLRNGTNAVKFAEEAVAGTHRENPRFLDTLAAAYAETQQFDKAVAVQQEAIGLAQSDKEKNDYDSRLKLYQAKKPFRLQANP
jgi:tetratricopeptide (TPR) repeat protein